MNIPTPGQRKASSLSAFVTHTRGCLSVPTRGVVEDVVRWFEQGFEFEHCA
jgi:hypothetical protein